MRFLPDFLMMVAAANTFLTNLRFPETYRIQLSDSASSAAAAYT
jgi:hypothetical protein